MYIMYGKMKGKLGEGRLGQDKNHEGRTGLVLGISVVFRT